MRGMKPPSSREEMRGMKPPSIAMSNDLGCEASHPTCSPEGLNAMQKGIVVNAMQSGIFPGREAMTNLASSSDVSMDGKVVAASKRSVRVGRTALTLFDESIS